MHRTDPYLGMLSFDAKSKDIVVNTLPLDADVALATVLPDKFKETQRFTPNLAQSSFRSRIYSRRTSSIGSGFHGSVGRMLRGDSNVIEPIRMLHNCIRYFASHPEVYGGNIRALLDRELLYVMRVKASETALMTPGTVPVGDTPLPPISNAKRQISKLQHPALDKCGGWMVTPRSIDAALSTGTVVGGEGMFGFGGVNFVEATPGFLSLLDKASRCLDLNEDRVLSEEGDEGEEESLRVLNGAGSTSAERGVLVEDGSRARESTKVHFLAGDERQVSNPLSPIDSGPKLLVDGASYEVSFLRNQLQQVEAAYNAKCIRLHELHQENSRHMSELNTVEKKLQQQTTKNNEMRQQIDALRRELDAWKQRASEINLNGHSSSSHGSADVSRRAQAMQFGEARRELAHMSRLWRETEKSLQETKRALEGSEKETQLSHQYLEDAFNLIERLERRIERRNSFIETQKRCHVSLEEKYEKLMWCLQELQTMKGVHSYVDYLLSEDPVWSLFLFVRLQRHLIGFAQLEEPLPLPSDAGPLYFRRTPCGGKLMDSFSPALVLRLMAEHVAGRLPNVVTVRRAALGICVPRWRGLHAVDYIGSDGMVSESGEGSRRNMPILTLASVLLPQQNAPVVGDVQVEEEVPNTAQYDQATMRLLMYCFWGERLMQYKREMSRRVEALRKVPLRTESNISGETTEGEGNSVDIFAHPPTFLAALVGFAQRLFPLSTNEEGAAAAQDGKGMRKMLSVRGVVWRNEKLWTNGRLFFSSIVSVTEDGTEIPVTLSSQARELLYALYYYAEEYKEVDADFRLFHLIAHQQIPEVVAINFYASLEALHKSCDDALCRHLGPKNSAEKDVSAVSRGESPSPSMFAGVPQNIVASDTPLNALRKAVELIDTAPLAEESTCIESDSDGEGFGLILPGKGRADSTQTAPRNEKKNKTNSDANKLKHDIREYLYPTEENTTVAIDDGLPAKNVESTNNDEKKEMPAAWVALDERLRAQLGPHASLLGAFQDSRNGNMSKAQSHKRRQFSENSASLSAARGLLPVDEFIALIHKHCFATYAVSCCGGARFSLFDTLAQNTRGGGVASTITSPTTHTAAGSVAPHNGEGVGELHPLAPIGQIPLTEMYVRRLRFAVAMDQPSTLVRYADLFAVDPRCGTPSHFHDEYLRLTLDIYLEQQEAWMNVILGSVASQHEHDESGVVEEPDGNVPFPVLRTGIATQFRELLLGAEQSNIFAKHFLNYCDLLRHENDIRLEQFTDAPFFVNTPSLTEHEVEADFASMEERRWPVEDEAASCSLLHISLAVRMTYVVWGFEAAPSARLAVASLPFSRHLLRVNSGSSSGQSTPGPVKRNHLFVNEVKRDYVDAVRRLKTGMAQHNELRKLAGELAGATPHPSMDCTPLGLPTFVKDTSLLAAAADVSLDVQRLYAPWGSENRQRQLQSQSNTPRAGRRSRSHKRSTMVSEPLPDAPVDSTCLLEVISLIRFMSLSRTIKAKSEKKKKRADATKGDHDIQTALLATCAENEAVFFSHQTQLTQLLVEAACEPDPATPSASEAAATEAQMQSNSEGAPSSWLMQAAPSAAAETGAVGGISSSADNAASPISSSGQVTLLPNLLPGDENGSEKLSQRSFNAMTTGLEAVSVRKVHAGCAALSLM